MKRNDYVVKTVYRSFVMVSVMTALIATVGMLIDNIVVGRFLGTECLSAMGLVSPVSMIFSAIGNISSSGGATMAARALGKGDTKKVHRIFTVTILYNLVTSVIITVIGVVFAGSIAIWLGAGKDTLQPTADYLRGYFLGAVPTIMLPTILGFVKLDGSTKLPAVSMATMTVLDVVLDIVAAVILHGGMYGMALATTIAYFAATAVSLLHFRRSYNTLKLTVISESLAELKGMVATGAPTAVNRVCETLKTVILNNMMNILAGSAAIAALNVRTQANSLIGSVIMGTGSAMMPIAGLFFGEEDETALAKCVKDCVRVGLVLCAVFMVFLLAVPDVFSSLLGIKEEAVVQMADVGICFFALSMPFRLFNVLWTSFYQSTGNNRHAMIISILQSLVFTVLTAVIFMKPFGTTGIFASFAAGEILTAVYIYFLAVRKSRKALPSLRDFMLLMPDFGNEVVKRWEFSVGNDINEVTGLSEKVMERAKEVDFDSHIAYTLALCIEEMAGNVVKHAFRPGKKQWFDLLILAKRDRIVFHMLDNGMMFDPLRYMEDKNAGPENGIGIRLIMAKADEIRYNRSIGLNNLTIEFHAKI